MHDYPAKKDLLHEVWVERADIDDVLEGTQSPSSVLSNDVQIALIKELLHGSERFPLAVVNPARAAPETLRMAFTISNMVGVDFGLRYAQAGGTSPAGTSPAETFPATFFADLEEISVDSTNTLDADNWKTIGDTALASGSFPIAFPPFSLHRTRDDYPGALPGSIDHLPGKQLFVDGGMFNNEPLKPCIKLSAEQDGGSLSEDRIFILIDPIMNTSKVDRSFLQPQDLLLPSAKRLVTMSAGEMTARDWLRIDRINTELEWRDGLVEELARTAAALPVHAVDSGRGELKAATEAVRDRKHEIRALEDGYLDETLKAIESNHREAFETIGGDAAAAGARHEWLRRMVFLLNNAAGLNSKSKISSLHVIGADKKLVAGDHFAAFAGFFNQIWREHDYRLGRATAHRRLPGILGVAYPREGDSADHDPSSVPVAGNPRYDPDPSWRFDPAKVEIGDAPKGKKTRFRNVVMDKIDGVLRRELELGWFLRKLAKRVVKKQLNKLLKL